MGWGEGMALLVGCVYLGYEVKLCSRVAFDVKMQLDVATLWVAGRVLGRGGSHAERLL